MSEYGTKMTDALLAIIKGMDEALVILGDEKTDFREFIQKEWDEFTFRLLELEGDDLIES